MEIKRWKGRYKLKGEKVWEERRKKGKEKNCYIANPYQKKNVEYTEHNLYHKKPIS